MRRSTLVLLIAGLCSTGCDWAAADGPWNEEPPTSAPLASASGQICTPDAQRGVGRVRVRWTDALDAVIWEGWTDPWGQYQAETAPGRYTVDVGEGVFSAVGAIVTDGDASTNHTLCLDRDHPSALVIRTALAASTDLIDGRLSGLGLDHVHAGPTDPQAAGQLFGAPASLVEYDVLAIAGRMDAEALAGVPGAIDGLLDFLDRGGGLYVAGEAWRLLELVAPGLLTMGGSAARGQSIEAFVHADLAEQLQWDRLGLRLHEGAPLFVAVSDEVEVLAWSEVETQDGDLIEAPLLIRARIGGGTIVSAAFLAPAPRTDEWWMGDPAALRLPDGSWDGRGAALDRVLLQL